ncbi:uncharacterized protein LOC143599549 [Bidens hawaiensis]|uniref:uncharacterized protein LOC143599549 n=1 Tax=Bidens hawaiensis TaxID=980011 RepID=UPI00404B8425
MGSFRKATNFILSPNGKLRRFNEEWYTSEFGNWLEYSVKADKVYCLHCYLFKESGQNDAFLSEGLRCWNRCREKFSNHVGKINSFHNKARKKGKDLLNQAQSIPVAIDKGTDLHKKQYRIRLHASARLTKALLNGSLAFRGHDESEESLYRGNFIEFLKVFGELSEEIEQMAVVLRYVDKLGFVKERFIGLVHVRETTALSLKAAIDDLFARHNLSIGRVRGQGYDGASNMSGEFNGLKALILKENSSAYYVHCFAHQLQLVVGGLATKHYEIYRLYKELSNLVNVVSGSCKRIDLLRESQRESLGLNSEVETGSGKNQELSLARAGDTRWSSHEKTILRLLTLYPCVIDVLEYIEKSGEFSNYQKESCGLQEFIKTFNFVFYLHLMKYILGVTNTLCQALQRKDQDMLNAVKLVKLTDEGLKRYRLEGFDSLLEDVTSFCEKYEIEVVDMEAEYVDPRFKRKKTGITNRHHYVVNNFNTVLDMQIQELGSRFNEVTIKLLTNMSSLSPSCNFSAFSKVNLINLAEMYPCDFDFDEKEKLVYELGHYITNVKEDKRFANLSGLGDLAKMMVKTRLHIDYPLVYRLIKLSLVLPVATASVERCFSSMKNVKTDLRNRMGDEYMNDSCICYIEREFLQQVSVEEASGAGASSAYTEEGPATKKQRAPRPMKRVSLAERMKGMAESSEAVGGNSVSDKLPSPTLGGEKQPSPPLEKEKEDRPPTPPAEVIKKIQSASRKLKVPWIIFSGLGRFPVPKGRLQLWKKRHLKHKNLLPDLLHNSPSRLHLFRWVKE